MRTSTLVLHTVNNSNTVTVTVTQPSYAVTGQWIKHRLRPSNRFVLFTSQYYTQSITVLLLNSTLICSNWTMDQTQSRSFSRFVLFTSPECQFYILHQKHLQFQTQHDHSQNNLAFLSRNNYLCALLTRTVEMRRNQVQCCQS